MDRELGYPDDQGPTIRKLQRYPQVLDLVCGAYVEVSDGVKRLLDCMAESRILSLGLRKGTFEASKELSILTGYLRRRLSTAIMRANVKCLLERLVMVGEGQGQAGKRRQWGGGRRREPGGTGRLNGSCAPLGGPCSGGVISCCIRLENVQAF